MSGPGNGQTRPPHFLRRMLRMVWLAVFTLSLTALFLVLWGFPTDTDLGEALVARRDYAAARDAFERAARGGSAKALWWLGRMCDEGLGTAPDATRALGYYQRAAAWQNLDAQTRAADLLAAPRDGEPGSPSAADLARAATWYATAGRRGDNEARAHQVRRP